MRSRGTAIGWIAAACLAGLLAGCGSGSKAMWEREGQSRRELRKVRADRRLYDGAPPVIPHEVASLGRENCLTCHTPGGMDNAEVIAPPRSHPAWGDCRQCHVEQRTERVIQESTFTPLRWPVQGHRQTGISPPMIPHHVQNREDCAVCHIGGRAHPALRAAHGYRANCRQCHVSMVR